jgi:hypothetical protein
LRNHEIRYPEIKEEFPPGVVVGRFLEREIEEPVELSGAEKKRSCADPDLWVWGGVCVNGDDCVFIVIDLFSKMNILSLHSWECHNKIHY